MSTAAPLVSEPDLDPMSSVPLAHDHAHTYAGFALRDLLLFAAGLAFTLWAVWATSVLLELRERRIVSVSLSSIIKDFVAAESRTGASPELAAARTKAYLAATDAAMRSLSRGGATVLVSEAVVGNSVPDMTAAVSAAVKAHMAQLQTPVTEAPASTRQQGAGGFGDN